MWRGRGVAGTMLLYCEFGQLDCVALFSLLSGFVMAEVDVGAPGMCS